MEKDNHPQSDLFAKSQGYSRIKEAGQRSFPGVIRAHEKAIFIIIGFIVISVVSFSFGVERGRKLAVLRLDSRLDMAAKIKSQESASVAGSQDKYQPVEQQQQGVIKTQVIKDDILNYTIQVASYQTKKYAEKEADRLRQKGFSPLVRTKGKYVILCVGRFPQKESAAPVLSKLKKRYQDCFVRKL
ncbi:MAG: SPOR domain-containing protein [Candidatus Omnitrophica bacterium]|nr:SPOR domain-containing protein [Candidatus Omnitrophota bacterium]MBU4345796.1 SPOR domain-containing protein [Candidatus Omnitrophota bacterium]MBU4473445.1 SPOR domain-containing protein [Candidatus Omnitrophota bacterium]MCG2706220.1 SPOR domain-containing protein [Candidatus Omnitrophota bacterium]